MFTIIHLKTRVFSNKIFLAVKNAKIRLFTLFRLKTLIFKHLSHFLLFLALLDCVFGLVILQNRPF